MGFFFMRKNKTTYKDYLKNSKKGVNNIPIYKRFFADVLTPVGAWTSLAQNSNFGFIFESVDNNANRSRYSYVGIEPKATFTSINGITEIRSKNKKEISNEPIFNILKKIQAHYYRTSKTVQF